MSSSNKLRDGLQQNKQAYTQKTKFSRLWTFRLQLKTSYGWILHQQRPEDPSSMNRGPGGNLGNLGKRCLMLKSPRNPNRSGGMHQIGRGGTISLKTYALGMSCLSHLAKVEEDVSSWDLQAQRGNGHLTGEVPHRIYQIGSNQGLWRTDNTRFRSLGDTAGWGAGLTWATPCTKVSTKGLEAKGFRNWIDKAQTCPFEKTKRLGFDGYFWGWDAWFCTKIYLPGVKGSYYSHE